MKLKKAKLIEKMEVDLRRPQNENMEKQNQTWNVNKSEECQIDKKSMGNLRFSSFPFIFEGHQLLQACKTFP